jgi:hypothetical protein
MSPGKQKSHLGESWVVEGNDDSLEYSPVDEESPPWRTPPRRPARGANKSPEPELVMPSLDVDSMDGSWADTTSRSARFQKSPRSGERAVEPRRRTRMSTGSPEKRTRTKTSVNKSSSQYASSAPRSSPTESSSAIQDILDATFEHAAIMLRYILEVIVGALRVLKTPMSYFIAVWLLFGLTVMVRNLITNSVYASLSPVCRIPGASLLNLPFCPVHRVDTSNGPPPPVEFDQLMTVQSKFEEVLEEGAGGVSLPLDMKRGEASIRDLRQLVRYSQLHSK